MLDCNACIRRCIQTVFSNILNTSRLPKASGPFPTLKACNRTPPWQRRRYTTAATAVQEVSQQMDASSQFQFRPRRNEFVGKDQEFKRTELEQELRYLKDPVKLADHTVSLLRQDDHDKALEIVRLGSKRMACTVSWNHLVDYEMSKGRVNSAMKLYNEMKKRAQPPDAHTYTIVLRGLAWHPHYQLSVSRAITIYNSMHADNCSVKPSIIHTNAVLKVCALAKDMDALWGVAAKLPTRGKAAPNNLSFTTILNAIRTVAWDDSSKYNKEVDEMSEQKNARRQQAVLQGRRMWDEIIGRWRSGDIVMDEEMVCSMGRLLLLGYDKRDYDDVLSLLEQTMAIPRPNIPNVPAHQSPKDLNETPSSQEANDLGAPTDSESALQVSPTSSQATSLASPSDEDEDAEPDYTPGGEFAPLPNSTTQKLPYARPGRNTLSLAIDACLRLHATRAAQDYWGLLTSPSGPYNIAPDSENYHMYLRLLRLQRASRLAVELVKEMKEGVISGRRRDMVQAKTFRIAMSSCVRDQKNKNSVLHAQELVHMMSETLEKPDVRALEMYLNVTSHSKDWRAMLASLHGTVIGVRNLRSLLAYGDKHEVSWRDKEETVAFVRRLVGCYDVAMGLGREEMQRDERQNAMEQRNRLTAWVTKQTNSGIGVKRKESGGNLETKSEAIDEPADQEDQPTRLGITGHTHAPRGRKSWEKYARDQPDGQRFERDDDDQPSSSLSDSDHEPSVRKPAPLQAEGWQRWSKDSESRGEGRGDRGHRRRRGHGIGRAIS